MTTRPKRESQDVPHRRTITCLSRSRGRLEDLAIFHYKRGLLERKEVIEWILGSCNYVGGLSGLNCTSLFINAKQSRGVRSHDSQSILCRHACFDEAVNVRNSKCAACLPFNRKECIRAVSHRDTDLVRPF